MVTKRYAHIMDEDRRTLAEEMDPSFYGNKKEAEPQADTSPELTAMMELLKSNPELLKQALQTVQFANKS